MLNLSKIHTLVTSVHNVMLARINILWQLQLNFKNNFIMKIILVFLLSICPIFFYGQVDSKSEVRIFGQYDDYVNNRYIVVKDTGWFGEKGNISIPDSYKKAWGIEKNKTLYRVFEDKIYEIADTSGLVIYTISFMKDHLQANSLWLGYPLPVYSSEKSLRRDYYFSTSLESEIYDLTKKNIIRHVNNKSFEKSIKKKFRWNSITAFDEQTNIFLVNELYNSALIIER